jgi:class 3 adenylate cyclase
LPGSSDSTPEALPAEGRLELRIGVHVGDVIVEGDRIAGDAVRHGSWRTQQGGAIYVHFTAQVRRALPADFAKRAREEGRALSVEQAFELALAMLPPA